MVGLMGGKDRVIQGKVIHSWGLACARKSGIPIGVVKRGKLFPLGIREPKLAQELVGKATWNSATVTEDKEESLLDGDCESLLRDLATSIRSGCKESRNRIISEIKEKLEKSRF